MERYDISMDAINSMITDPDGAWVRWEDAKHEIDSANTARRHAQAEGTKLVERVRELEAKAQRAPYYTNMIKLELRIQDLQSQLAAERERIRAATQIIIEEIGATGPAEGFAPASSKR